MQSSFPGSKLVSIMHVIKITIKESDHFGYGCKVINIVSSLGMAHKMLVQRLWFLTYLLTGHL